MNARRAANFIRSQLPIPAPWALARVGQFGGVVRQADLLFLTKGSRHAPAPRLTHENWG